MGEYVEGKVKAISEKDVSGGVMRNIKVDIDGNEDWFGHGFDEPIFGKGDTIGFEISLNGDFENIDTGTVEILEAAPKKSSGRSSRQSSGRGNSSGRNSKPAARSGGRSGGGNRNSKPAAKRSAPAKSDTLSKDEWAQKDQHIRRQSAFKQALGLVGLLLANDAVKLPAAQAKKADAICAAVDMEADRIYDMWQEQVYGEADEEGGRYSTDVPE